MPTEIVPTKDGSHTVFSTDYQEHYHSVFGAVQESQHVFIQSGLQAIEASRLRIFEAGFGTGLNALLALQEAQKTGKEIDYQTVELFPLSPAQAALLNYPQQVAMDKALFRKLHECPWHKAAQITPAFRLTKYKTDIQNIDIQIIGTVNLIFFDAFSPETQAGLWTTPVFATMYELLDTNGILTTYSVKGRVRRNLQAAGFEVERLPGPPGKRHILRARK